MVKSKEELVKSINAAFIIGSIMLYGMAALFFILFFVWGFEENSLEDYIVLGGFFLFFMITPAIVLQVIRRKFWVKKHADILKK